MSDRQPPQTAHSANFVKDIHSKSDRAVAIVGSALLKAHVEQLLAAFFIANSEEVSALIGQDRPLGSFGAQVRLAYLAGLISREEYEDLWAVNQIDGAFTRDLGELNFNDRPVSEWCHEMRLPNKVLLSGEMRTPRRMFVCTTALLLRQLAMRIEMAESRRAEPPDPFSLVQVDQPG